VSRETKWVTGGVYKGTPSAMLEEFFFVVYYAINFTSIFFFFTFISLELTKAVARPCELLEEFITNFYGYGKLKSDYWFVGMEEGGGENIDEIIARLNI
jgi:hypothetical protein